MTDEAAKDHPQPLVLWTNRRRMAWLSIWMLVVTNLFTLYMAWKSYPIGEEHAALMKFLVYPFVAVVIFYTGAVALADKWRGAK